MKSIKLWIAMDKDDYDINLFASEPFITTFGSFAGESRLKFYNRHFSKQLDLKPGQKKQIKIEVME